MDLRGGTYNRHIVNPAQRLASMAIKISTCYIKMTHVLRLRDEWKGADLGLQLRGRQRGGQGAAVLLRGHRLPGPPALSPPCSQQIPLLQRPGAHFPSVRVKFLLKRFSVLPFTWKNHRWTRSRNGLWLCLGG